VSRDDPRAARRAVWSWALYDWGNSAFATTVLAGFFPLFFRDEWYPGHDPTAASLRLGVANSLAGVAVALTAPVLGAVADRGGSRKRFLLAFTVVGVVATGALALVGRGQWIWAVALFIAGSIGFSAAMSFYDSLLVAVARPDETDAVSSFGYAVGYLGGGLLFAVNVLMALRPTMFGLAGASSAVRMSFVAVAVWWAVFTVPLALWVPEPPAANAVRGAASFVAGWRSMLETLRAVRQHPMVWRFLLAYWLYIDGVDTIIRMAVDYGRALGFSTTSLIAALLITQFVGLPAALGFVRIARRIGTRRAILVGLAVYVGIALWGARMQHAREFFALAVAVGLVQGGVQALSRSLFARLIPPERSGEFFGFYNMLGKFAVVIGPALMGVVGRVTHSTRASIAAVAALFVAGGLLLTRVRETEA